MTAKQIETFRECVAALRAIRAETGNAVRYMQAVSRCQRAWGLLHTGRDGYDAAMTSESRSAWSRILVAIFRWADLPAERKAA